MASKHRLFDEDSEGPRSPKYCSEIPWLYGLFKAVDDPTESAGLIQSSSSKARNKEAQSSIRQAFKPGLSNDESNNQSDSSEVDAITEDQIWEACKWSYLLYHTVDYSPALTKATQSLDRSQITKKQTAWRSHILNKFLLPHVKELARAWCAKNPWRFVEDLDVADRDQIWIDEWNTDPSGIVRAMWKPVVDVLDLEHVFSDELIFEDEKEKTEKLKQMFRDKYVCGCNLTWMHRVRKIEVKGKKVLITQQVKVCKLRPHHKYELD